MRLSPFALIDAVLIPPPAPARVEWIAAPGFAHRGLHGPGVLENSPAAFEAAMARGLGIECDVQRSADGEAMVFHDWELDRLTGESGLVMARHAAELGRIALKGEADAIPTLTAVLDQVAGRAPLLIEVKSKAELPVDALCRAVHRALRGYTGQHAVMSFDPRVARWFFRQAPEILRGLVITEEGEKGWSGRMKRRLALWHSRAQFLAYDIRDLPSRAAAWQRVRGLPVATWTVRSAELLARAARHADAPIAEGAGVS